MIFGRQPNAELRTDVNRAFTIGIITAVLSV